MEALKHSWDETDMQHQDIVEKPAPEPPPTRHFKADPSAGRKMSREEAIDYIFKKNEGLLRRLACY